MKKRILSTLLALCMMLALLPGTALAEDQLTGTCGDNATWTLTGSGKLTISGSGKMYDYGYYSFAPWNKNRDIIKTVVISKGISHIGTSSFSECKNLTSVTISSGVNSIGDYAFKKCSMLKNVTLPATVSVIGESAFEGCTKLSAITLPKGITTIGSYAFTDCVALKNITIPEGVINLGSYVFTNCSNLTSVKIPSSVEKISSYTFGDCTSLVNVTIADGVTEIGERAFAGCTNLTKLAIPASVTRLGSQSFSGCTNLTDIAIPDGVKTLPYQLFNNCSSLKSIVIPSSVTSIENMAFSGCDRLKDIYFSGGQMLWNNISISYGNDPLNRAVKHYNSTGPATACTIKLNANSGKVTPSSIKVDSGESYFSQLPTPTRSGYKFTGWYTSKTGGTQITSDTKATANCTIYAHWTRNKTYVVSFDANGGMVDMDQKIVRTRSLYGPLPTPVKDGVHFKGWYTKKSGGTKVTETTCANLSAPQTLYAQWQTASVKSSVKPGSYKVTVPAYYELALYTTSNSAKIAAQVDTTGDQTITCTQKATLSNGTVRYYGKVKNNKSYWFTYSCEMYTK